MERRAARTDAFRFQTMVAFPHRGHVAAGEGLQDLVAQLHHSGVVLHRCVVERHFSVGETKRGLPLVQRRLQLLRRRRSLLFAPPGQA